MTTTRAKSLLAEQRRRQQFPTAVQSALDALFDLQRDLVFSTGKRKVVRAGRRGGKTRALSAAAFRAALNFPGATIPVFERTLTCTAAETFWKELQDLDTQFKLGIKFHHTQKTATLANKSVIALMGADTIEACDKARGGKFPVALIDEAGTYRSKVLEYLVTEVLEPASIDFDGEIIVSGTPNLSPTGFFYSLTVNAAWARFHWTLLENPTLGKGTTDAERRAWRADWLTALRVSHHWDEHSPQYVREYMGEWTTAVDSHVYRFDRGKNIVTELPVAPRNQWRYVLAMDLGYNDPTAFVVLGQLEDDPYIYIVESFEKTELIPSAVAAQVEQLRTRYDFVSIVADTGGYGKAVAEEMIQRYGIPVKAAAKRDKRVYIEHANGDLSSGKVKVLQSTNRELVDDMLSLPWDDDREDSHPNYRDHLPDAFLYGTRELRSLDGLGERDGPSAGSAEWFAAEEAKMWKQLEEQVERERVGADFDLAYDHAS